MAVIIITIILLLIVIAICILSEHKEEIYNTIVFPNERERISKKQIIEEEAMETMRRNSKKQVKEKEVMD